MSESVFVLLDDDCVQAIYRDKEIAVRHEKELGGLICECKIFDSIHPDAVDPQKILAREREAIANRKRWESIRADEQRRAEYGKGGITSGDRQTGNTRQEAYDRNGRCKPITPCATKRAAGR